MTFFKKTVFPKPEEQLKALAHNAKDVISKEQLLSKLTQSFKTNTPLRIKAGFDPTHPHLHLGHSVLLTKLKTFQDMGHKVLFLIGDWTAQIGDPSGCSQTRPLLTKEEVKKNAQTYAAQVFKILKPAKTKIVFNSQWMNGLTAGELMKLSGQYTVARMLERDDFSKRFKNGSRIALHEFLYPLVQGYDSVVLKSDVEIGAVDQIFNLLMGRHLQQKAGQEPQCVLTFPLLIGTDNVKKMSKSYNNFIALDDSPKNMFGKTMKINDTQMLNWYALLTHKNPSELEQLKKELSQGGLHPKTAKMNLAEYVTKCFYGAGRAKKERQAFEQVFCSQQLPIDMKVLQLKPQKAVWICYLLREIKFSPSTSAAKRLINEGGLAVNGQKIRDPHLKIDLKKGDELIIKAGKRNFIKIKAD